MAQEIADSTLLDTWASGGNIVEPDISKIIEGWQLGEQPPHEYMNWLQNIFGSKLNHILKNGVASWNNETEYLAGSSVQHNGNAWLCKTTNTNSEPADVNSKWKRIITIEALENLLVGYVALTGNQTIAGVKTFSSTISGSISGNAATVTNGVYTTGEQTIAGVKTFSSSPIVPTPTTDDNSTKVATTAFVKAKSETDSIGIGQTWQGVSRSAGVTYTNSTGKPIMVVVTCLKGGNITVEGTLIAYIDEYSTGEDGDRANAWFIVPNNQTYRVNAPLVVIYWTELR